jgi:transcriptional regulator with XRE-family HTH domain
MRLELGLTQQELAEMIGAKHKASISKIEKEERNCTLGMLNRLAKAFGCNPLSLILIKEE